MENNNNNSNNYTKEQYNVLTYSNTQFDKSVLFIASGALGISFAFIEKIIPNLKGATNKCLLIISWYFFAGVIFMSLINHFLSILANRWAIANEGITNYNEIEKKWNLTIRIINILMIIGLFVGIIFLINFTKQNI